MGHIPVGMELFNPSDDSQWNVIKKLIDESDYYVLIVSDRYGSLDTDGIGFTEKEYDYAIEKSKPTITFLRFPSSIDKLSYAFRESDNKEKLKIFKEKTKNKLIKFWDQSSDLSIKFILGLNELIETKPQSGWVKGNNINGESFFYTLDDQPHANFSHLVKGAKSVYVLARTGVNLLGQYERTLVELHQSNCDIRFLFVGPESDAVKYIYAGGPEIYFENAKKMDFHIKSIKKKTGKEIFVNTIKHAPTVSIIYIEKENESPFLIVQFYFLHALIGRDRPLFRLDESDKWFYHFKYEFDKLWEESEIWKITNSKEND